MKNRFALLFAVLGFATIVCVLLFSRDNKLQYQNHMPSPSAAEVSPVPANASGLSPTIQTLAETPTPVPEATPSHAPAKPEAEKQPLPKAEAAKAKG